MWKKHWSNASLLKKLVTTYLLLVIIPIVVFSFVVYKAYIQSMQNSVNRYADETLRQILLNIDTNLNTLAQLSLTPYYNESLLDLWTQVPESLQAQVEMDNRTADFSYSSIMKGNPAVVGVYFFGTKGQMFGHMHLGYVKEGFSVRQTSWYPYVDQAKGRPVFINLDSPSYIAGNDEVGFAVARQMYNTRRELLGTFVLFVKKSRLNEIAENAQSKEIDKLYLLDIQNQLIYGKIGNSEEERLIMELAQKGPEAEGQKVKLKGQTYRVGYDVSDFSQIRSFYLIPSIKLVDHQRNVVYLILGFAFFATVISFFIFVWIARRITKPLKRLQLLMREVEKGNFDVSYQVRSVDEIGLLGASFNHMISQMRRLVYEVYEAELKKKQADFISLQHQIRPHFLYNVLETVNMMAEVKGVHEIGDMISSVGELLRLSLHRKDRGTLEEEIRYVKSYIHIQQRFYKNQLNVDIRIPDDILRRQCIKFILQPIVENAILHGLDERKGTLNLEIRGTIEGGRIRLYVTDDGKGMDELAIRNMLSHLTAPHPESIGLRNVLDRIRLYHGPLYGIRICTMEGAGTTVQITLPEVEAISNS
mgnify:CR=1 FL=1